MISHPTFSKRNHYFHCCHCLYQDKIKEYNAMIHVHLPLSKQHLVNRQVTTKIEPIQPSS